jgi:hypothetical protein
MSPAQREQIKLALGRDVLSVAQEIHFCLNSYGKADADLWRKFLEALHKSAGDEVMNAPLGLTIQLAILGRIQGEQYDGASLPRRGGGFPSNPRG